MNEGAMNDSERVMEATGVERSFRQGPIDLQVLQGVNLSVRAGERLAIIGASGSGKTTLLQILGGLDRPTAGHVKIAGSDIHALDEKSRGELRNRTLGFIYQFHHLLPEFSALENVEMPMRIARVPAAEARPRAEALLGRVGLAERLGHRPSMLSGGEQQRVAVARALVRQPALLLADEPTGDLDEATADALHGLLRDMHREFNLTAVIATHNPRLAQQCDRVLRLEGGRLTPG